MAHQLVAVNSLWPSDAIWRQRSGTRLAQVMACCLTAPRHYLNQCWFTISNVHWHSFEYKKILQPSITEISWKIIFLKFLWNLPGANELTLNMQMILVRFADDFSEILPAMHFQEFRSVIFKQILVIDVCLGCPVKVFFCEYHKTSLMIHQRWFK